MWSAEGSQIAFLRNLAADRHGIASIALIDRRERHRADFRKAANAWFDGSRDGQWFAVAEPTEPGAGLAITLIASTGGGRRAITAPPPHWRGDSQPVFSPDSSRIAFRRTTAEWGHEDIHVVPVAGGAPERWTTDDRGVGAYCFEPQGGLLFSSQREATLRSLWWIGPHGKGMTKVIPGTVDTNMPAVSLDGRHAAFTRVVYDVNVWRISTEGEAGPQVVIDSAVPDTSARLSPDGRRIAFQSDRSVDAEVWTAEADGAHPVRLTSGRGEELGHPE